MRYRPKTAREEAGFVEGGGVQLSFGAALWRMRVAIIGLLLLAVGLYGFTAIRTGSVPTLGGQQEFSTVGIGTKFSGTRWDWIVNSVQRVQDAGSSRAQGVYYVVRIGATNKGTDSAQLAPSAFTLVDANGVEHTASGLGSGAYQGPDNPGSPNIWPRTFPVGKTVTFGVVFEIDRSLPRGMQLALADLPSTRVKLD